MFAKTLISITLFCALFGALKAEEVDNCPQICPALYAPVCATDGKIFKEFSNDCELKTSNCRLERSSLKSKYFAKFSMRLDFYCSAVNHPHHHVYILFSE